MTRPTNDTSNFKAVTSYAPHGRPPADLIDKRFAPIFTRLDKLKENRSVAESLVNHLADPARDTEATAADDAAAAEAIAKGKDAPDRDNETKLAADRKQAALNFAGYAEAIRAVENEADDLRGSIAPDTSAMDTHRERIRGLVELLAEEHTTFLAAEAVHQWSTNGIYLSRPNYNPQDLIPELGTGARGHEYQSAQASALFATLANTLTN